MITKIDNYYMGQSVNEAPGLREHTSDKHKYDKKVFDGNDVVFNGVTWRTLVGVSGEKICKIVIQNVSKDRATFDQTFKSTLNYLETEMGPGVMGNYNEKEIYYNWESPEGNLLLDRQDKLGLYCVGVKIWQPDGVSHLNMKNQEKTSISVSESELRKHLTALAGRTMYALFPLFIFSIVKLIKLGNKGDYFLLLAGCVLSFVAISGYIGNISAQAIKKQRSFLAMFLTFGGFIPWLFGCYLVFVRGFWSLKELAGGFSFLVIIKALVFIVLGYVIVSKFYQITEVEKRIQTGKLIINTK